MVQGDNRFTSQSIIWINAGSVGGIPERLKGSDCKSDGSAFEGSNPSPTTRFSNEQGVAGVAQW